jgi:hypothetical protein
MLVRISRGSRAGGMRRARGGNAWRLGLLLLAAGVPAAGCRQNEGSTPPIEWTWTMSPASAVVGPARLTITLRAPSGNPVAGAAVRLEAHMSHPGMAPVLASATERAPGTYDIPFAFTMRGDWVLLVSAALPDGHRIERRLDVANVRPSG